MTAGELGASGSLLVLLLSSIPSVMNRMTVSCVLLLVLALAKAEIGVDIGSAVPQADFACLKSKGVGFVMYAFIVVTAAH